MKRNKFNLSYTHLLSCDMGELVPIGLMEVLPGDTVQMASSLLVRASPLLAPVMHRIDVRVHHFFVPFRLIWTSFQDFITAGPTGTSVPVPPFLPALTVTAGSLVNYLGLPVGNVQQGYSALPVRAYNLIYNEYYRDEDLNVAQSIALGDGIDGTTNETLLNVDWEKDYLTSARPWEQKGPSVTLPLGTRAPISGLGKASGTYASSGVSVFQTAPPTSTTYANAAMIDPGAANNQFYVRGAAAGPGALPDVYADLTNATAATVNTIRQAMALQRYEENRARYGSRYTEYLRYLGVRSSDARLQRPEYLGGGRQVIQFSEVLQTAQDGTNPVGTLRGHGISAVRSNRFRRFIEEHGLVLSLLSLRPKTIYSQGVGRMWRRLAKEDYWQQELQHIGQQKVYTSEVFGTVADLTTVFGYQDRYDEYRRNESRVSGEFATSSLNFWHLARDFAVAPTLNGSFVTCSPTERVFAVPSSDNVYVMAQHHVVARRLVAKTGTSFIF